LHGRALGHWFAGDHDARVDVIDDAGEIDPVQVELFFRAPDQLEPWERIALDACRGKVLDLGAGAGTHALALAARGLQVTAVDISAEAVAVMQARGVQDARCTTLPDLANRGAAHYDTIITLMHGAGLAGDLDGLTTLLEQASQILAPQGTLILDSRDPGCGAAIAELQISYQGQLGKPFNWLYIDTETLSDVARAAGFHCERLYQDDEGRHVCRLAV
jgi:SAM-dependent methyltransferase